MTEKVPFGFQRVDPEQKTSLVRAVFERVAGRYDLMNDIMSLGVHRLWKDHLIRAIHSQPGHRLLDVAGGTGDVSFRFLQACPGSTAIVCDINQAMLSAGRQRSQARQYSARLDWVCGDAAQLPFPDHSFDTYTISFGLRNVTDIACALREAHRVLKPGGGYFCLEFSKVKWPLLDQIYKHYSFGVIPQWGEWIAKDRAAYQYLVESIARFPDQETLGGLMREAGFAQVSYDNLSGGIAAIHAGWKV